MKVKAIEAFNENRGFYWYSLGSWGRIEENWHYPAHNANRILYNGWNKQFNVGASVQWYADKINGTMNQWWYGTRYYSRGIQLMDFYWQGNVDQIIRSNPGYR